VLAYLDPQGNPIPDTTWSVSRTYWDQEFTVSLQDGYNAGTVTLNGGSSLFEWSAFVTVMASRFATMDGTMDYPSTYTLKVKRPVHGGDNDACNFTHESGSTSNGHIRLHDGCAHNKFTIGHEFGHAVGAAGESNLRGGDEGGTSQIEFCNCNGVTGVDNFDHCIQGKETARKSEAEGWAHFVSAAAMNDRSGDSGIFGYYKSVKQPAPGGKITCSPPYRVVLADSSGPLYRRQMQTYCYDSNNASGEKKYGIEWDWAHFFWNLWHKGTYKLDIDEIRDVWPQDADDLPNPIDEHYYWGYDEQTDPDDPFYIVDRADGQLSASEYSRFKSIGDDAAINLGWPATP
jgi:hypothetical protein